MVRIGTTIFERRTNFRWPRAPWISPNEFHANLGRIISKQNDDIFVFSPAITIIDWQSLTWNGVLEEVCWGATLCKNIDCFNCEGPRWLVNKVCTLTTYEQRKGVSIFLYFYFVLFLQNVLPRNLATMYPLSIRELSFTYARKPSRIQIVLAFSSDLCYNSYHNIKVLPMNLWLPESY